MTPQDLQEFIREAEGLGAKRFVLRQLLWDPKGHAAYSPLMTWDLERWEAGRAALADAIVAWAQKDADDTGGAQDYALLAVCEGNELAQRRWRIVGAKLLEHAGGPTEAPTPVGQIAQAMRHIEFYVRSFESIVGKSFKLHAKSLDRAETTIDKQQAEIDKMRDRELLVIEKLEHLMMHEHTRKMEEMQLTTQLEQRTKLFNGAIAQIEPVVPMLLAKLLKQPLVPAQVNTALDALLTSLTDEQTSQIGTILTPGQLASLAQIYRERAAAQKAADDAKEAAAAKASSSSGEATPASSGTNGAPAT